MAEEAPPSEALSATREEIDAIDLEVTSLLHRRAAIVDRVRAAKRRAGTQTYDPAREEEVLERVLATANAGRFPRGALRAVFREIISGCVALQQNLSVAYLGPPGSFTHVAAIALFGSSADLRDVPAHTAVLDAIARGEVAFGVVPFESSFEGFILDVIEGMSARGLKIRREYVCSISYALASRATTMSDVRLVYGHPVQFDHCRRWLSENVPHARLASEQSPLDALENAKLDPASAVLVSRHAADQQGLGILAERANDRVDDAMRFIVVAGKPGDDARADKTAFVVTPRVDGSLTELLRALAAYDVELLRLASRPHPSAPWQTHYFVEARGKESDAQIQAVIDSVSLRIGAVTVLGSYFTHRAVSWSIPPAAKSDRDVDD